MESALLPRKKTAPILLFANKYCAPPRPTIGLPLSAPGFAGLLCREILAVQNRMPNVIGINWVLAGVVAA